MEDLRSLIRDVLSEELARIRPETPAAASSSSCKRRRARATNEGS